MPILALIKLTAMDLVRRRIFVLLALFAFTMVLLSFFLRDLTIGQWTRLITDVGLGATDLALTLLAIFVGASLIAGDLDKRTLLPLLAKPLSRTSFIYGRFLGLFAILAALVTATSAGTAAMLWLSRQSDYGTFLAQNGVTIFVSSFTLGSIAILMSCITSTTLASITALTCYLAGHLTSNLAYFAGKLPSGPVRWFLMGFSKLLPNLELLNLKDLASRGETISASDLLVRVGYGVAYSIITLSLGAIVFARRDLK